MYAVVSLIMKGEGLFENRYSPKNTSSSGNNITRAKRFGIKEYDNTAYESLNLIPLLFTWKNVFVKKEKNTIPKTAAESTNK